MEVVELGIAGAWVVTPRQHGDGRGLFLEWFKDSAFREATGHSLNLAQANCSVSAAGTVRGIHFADVPPGQAKYVTCLTGAVLDVVVDIRVGSPTFGRWEAVRLDTADRRAVYLSEGLGHGFAALEDGSTVAYLCSEEYNPEKERELYPYDAEIGVDWGFSLGECSLSAKDDAAPTLAEAAAAGILPDYEVCRSFRAGLK
ncbi:MAG: dTDP-4-dehydrorhamnose 3,5-epimerase [Actinomycetota bacterium]|nr:dTDP-4-dehydrorhamnose 3,5-epimerase [Actinomycetota bacterium]